MAAAMLSADRCGAGAVHAWNRVLPPSVERGWAMVCAHLRAVCAQMFNVASAFNQNVGGWNVARVSSMSSVCSVASHASGLDCLMMCFEPQALDGMSTASASSARMLRFSLERASLSALRAKHDFRTLGHALLLPSAVLARISSSALVYCMACNLLADVLHGIGLQHDHCELEHGERSGDG